MVVTFRKNRRIYLQSIYFTSSEKDSQKESSCYHFNNQRQSPEACLHRTDGEAGVRNTTSCNTNIPLERNLPFHHGATIPGAHPWVRTGGYHHSCSVRIFKGVFSKAPTDFGSVLWASKIFVFAVTSYESSCFLKSRPSLVKRVGQSVPDRCFPPVQTTKQGKLDMPVVSWG